MISLTHPLTHYLKMKNIIINLFACSLLLGACVGNNSTIIDSHFHKSEHLSQQVDFPISEDSIGRIEGIVCDDNNLIIYDFHTGNSYTLFDAETGEYISRFGTIGQGPGEILLGCFGYLSNGNFLVYNNSMSQILGYRMDSLRKEKRPIPAQRLAKYKLPEMNISRIVPLCDSLYIGGGCHISGSQYALFDKNGKVLDYSIDTYNAKDDSFNKFTKYLSNQGDFVKHPHQNKFAYSVNYSSNLDFFEVKDSKIKQIKLQRWKNPILKSVVEGNGTMFSATPTEKTETGYINICSTSQYLYALHSEKSLYENWRKSTTVLVFDWNGSPVKKYILPQETYYIAVNEKLKRLYAAVKNKESGWSIACYKI